MARNGKAPADSNMGLATWTDTGGAGADPMSTLITPTGRQWRAEVHTAAMSRVTWCETREEAEAWVDAVERSLGNGR